MRSTRKKIALKTPTSRLVASILLTFLLVGLISVWQTGFSQIYMSYDIPVESTEPIFARWFGEVTLSSERTLDIGLYSFLETDNATVEMLGRLFDLKLDTDSQGVNVWMDETIEYDLRVYREFITSEALEITIVVYDKVRGIVYEGTGKLSN